MKTVSKQNFAIISTFARELARNLRAKPFPVEVVGGTGQGRSRPEDRRRGTSREGKKGRQTEYMAKQRKAFLDHLKIHPETASMKRMTLARDCWAIHRREWDAAAKNGVGYSSYKALAYARLI